MRNVFIEPHELDKTREQQGIAPPSCKADLTHYNGVHYETEQLRSNEFVVLCELIKHQWLHVSFIGERTVIIQRAYA
jgi:hypothetical protein